jgi:hypothetical protein
VHLQRDQFGNMTKPGWLCGASSVWQDPTHPRTQNGTKQAKSKFPLPHEDGYGGTDVCPHEETAAQYRTQLHHVHRCVAFYAHMSSLLAMRCSGCTYFM